MSSGLLSLKWNNHRSTFFHVLSSIRSKESYCDATLACDGRFYPVHKLVLSTCSEYFEQIFDRTQCKHPVIVLKDIRHDDLEALMNYMYVGEVNVMQEKLPGLIKAAECLKIKGLAVPDEDPSSIKDLRRNQHRNEIESPRAKRKRKDDYASSEERGRTFSSRDTPFSRVSHKEQLLETNINALHNKINSPHGSNALDDKVSESSYQKSLSKNQSGDEETGTSANESSISINDGTAKLITTKRLSETSIEETSVKSEPPDIIVPEEVDIKENIPVAFDYDPSDEGNSVTADDIDNGHDGEDSDYANNVTESGHKNLDETTTQSLPSSSNNQANVFSMWEGESSSQNFPSEDFNRENSQGRSMMDSDRPQESKKQEESPVEDRRGSASRSCSVSPSPPSDVSQNATFLNAATAPSYSNALDLTHSIQSFLSRTVQKTQQREFRGESSSSTPTDSINFGSLLQSPPRSKSLICACHLCHKTFPTPTALKVHMRIHTGEKPFSCCFCLYKTAQKGNLATHLRTHTGERPYVCSICSCSFKSGSALTGHIRSKHHIF